MVKWQQKVKLHERKPQEKGQARSVYDTHIGPAKNKHITVVFYTEYGLRKAWSTLGLGEETKEIKWGRRLWGVTWCRTVDKESVTELTQMSWREQQGGTTWSNSFSQKTHSAVAQYSKPLGRRAIWVQLFWWMTPLSYRAQSTTS